MEKQNKNQSRSAVTYFGWQTGILTGLRVFLIASSAIFLFSTHSAVFAAGLIGKEAEIIQLTNQIRQQQGLPILSVDEQLNISAEAKAENMAVNGYFSHVDKNGIRMGYWIISSGYNYLRAGENLAKGFTNVEDLMTAWINSPTHYANLVNANYREIGIGIASGHIDGRATIFVVQHFAEPMPQFNLIPAAMAKPVINPPSVLGESLLAESTQRVPVAAVLTGQYNEATAINNSPAGLLLIAYDNTKDSLLNDHLVVVSRAAGSDITLALPDRGYQLPQVTTVVLVALGLWGQFVFWLRSGYAWLRKLKNKT